MRVEKSCECLAARAHFAIFTSRVAVAGTDAAPSGQHPSLESLSEDWHSLASLQITKFTQPQ